MTSHSELTESTAVPSFRFEGHAELQSLNIRKRGNDDEKVLVVDARFSGRAHADLCDYFDPLLRSFLFLDGVIARPRAMDPIGFCNVIEHCELRLPQRLFTDVQLRHFRIEPHDGGQIQLSFTATFRPSKDEVAVLAEFMDEDVHLVVQPEPELDFNGQVTAELHLAEPEGTPAATPPAAKARKGRKARADAPEGGARARRSNVMSTTSMSSTAAPKARTKKGVSRRAGAKAAASEQRYPLGASDLLTRADVRHIQELLAAKRYDAATWAAIERCGPAMSHGSLGEVDVPLRESAGASEVHRRLAKRYEEDERSAQNPASALMYVLLGGGYELKGRPAED